ncbi:MAG: hypothetical protein ABIJ47_10840 [Candidatus Bathyarchaeota archaeon]
MTEHDPYFEEGDPWMDDCGDEEDLGCGSCGPWCPEWGGDGLCMLAIMEQARQREEYLQLHTRIAACPVCGTSLKEYDVYSGDREPWTWSLGFYDPMIAAMDVMGPLWLNKGVLHSQGSVYHIWIEWGTGREERLLRYLEHNPLEAVP